MTNDKCKISREEKRKLTKLVEGLGGPSKNLVERIHDELDRLAEEELRYKSKKDPHYPSKQLNG